jgi:hypothetical protein
MVLPADMREPRSELFLTWPRDLLRATQHVRELLSRTNVIANTMMVMNIHLLENTDCGGIRTHRVQARRTSAAGRCPLAVARSDTGDTVSNVLAVAPIYQRIAVRSYVPCLGSYTRAALPFAAAQTAPSMVRKLQAAAGTMGASHRQECSGERAMCLIRLQYA